MKRKLLLIVALLLLPISAGILWLLLPTDPVNAANFERIEIGMNENDVRQILGDPTPSETKLGISGRPMPGGLALILYEESLDWERPNGTSVSVYFVNDSDRGWIVVGKHGYFRTFGDRLTDWWHDFLGPDPNAA